MESPIPYEKHSVLNVLCQFFEFREGGVLLEAYIAPKHICMDASMHSCIPVAAEKSMLNKASKAYQN